MKLETNRFRKEFKIWKACAKKRDKRANLEYVVFKDGYTYASNAHILVKVNVKDLTLLADDEQYALLNGYCIHADAIKALTNCENIDVVTDGENVSIVCKIGENTLTFGLAPTKKVNAPDFEAVLKAEGKQNRLKRLVLKKLISTTLPTQLARSALRWIFTANLPRSSYHQSTADFVT